MNVVQLNQWIENFNKEIEGIKISFDAFFVGKPIENYYNLKVDKEQNNIVLELIDEDELPNEVINWIMDAYKKAKPAI